MAKDKQKHLLVGTLIYILVAATLGPLYGLVAAIIIGAGKELIWDLALGQGTPEWADFWYTIVVPVILYLLIAG